MGGAAPPEKTVGAAVQQPLDLPALFEKHYLQLVRLASQLVDDLASAEDVVQDVFTRLQSRRGPIMADEPLAYLRTAVLNTARSALRRRRTARAFHVSRRPRTADEVQSADGRVPAAMGPGSHPAGDLPPSHPAARGHRAPVLRGSFDR